MPDFPIGKPELVKFYLILRMTCEINEVPVMRKLLSIFITLVVASLPASGQEQEKTFFDEFGELYRTEGLLSDIELLLDHTKKIFSFKLAWDAPPTIRSALEAPQSSLYSNESKTLFSLVWQPLLRNIPRGSSIVYSPDGLLNMFNLEVASDGQVRLCDEYSVRRVSSTREVCRASTPGKNFDAVLYGGLQYEMTESEMLERSARYWGNSHTLRGLDGIDRAGWAALPGSGREVEDVSAILSSYGHPVRIMKGMEGTEESFKSLSGKSPMILHLATHGFYYDKGRESDSWYYESLLLQGSKFGPFVRSGLVLAGGQKAWLGEPVSDKVEDGILLSEEIAELDLSGTKFLTLSACETALGDVTPEGVTGLQAAYKRAGVGTMLMSLWKVDDDATREFMTAFYRSLCETGYYQDAIQAARRQMQSSSKYSNPYYWAGFVIID